jgi:hypothetical protein
MINEDPYHPFWKAVRDGNADRYNLFSTNIGFRIHCSLYEYMRAIQTHMKESIATRGLYDLLFTFSLAFRALSSTHPLPLRNTFSCMHSPISPHTCSPPPTPSNPTSLSRSLISLSQIAIFVGIKRKEWQTE